MGFRITDRYGPCHVCGMEGPLSFEHVPPKSAGNRDPAEMLDIFQALAKAEGKNAGRGQISQRGSGAYALCRRCNERAGGEYVPEFLRWVAAGAEMLGHADLEELDQQQEPAFMHAELQGTRPALLVKQIATMLLALAPTGFALHRDHLLVRDFAQDPEWRGLPDRYQLYLVLYVGEFMRLNGGTAVATVSGGKLGSTYMLEMAAPPLAWILTVDEDSPPVRAGNITGFADLGFHQKANVSIDLQIGFGHTPFPADFRSRAAVDKAIAESRRRTVVGGLWTPPGSVES